MKTNENKASWGLLPKNAEISDTDGFQVNFSEISGDGRSTRHPSLAGDGDRAAKKILQETDTLLSSEDVQCSSFY